MPWFEFDSFRFDGKERILQKDGREVALAPKAADLLLLFLENPGYVFSHQELNEKVWHGASRSPSNVHFQLSMLRRTLGQRPDGSAYVENLPRRGFRFVAPVQKHKTDPISPGPAKGDLPAPAPDGESAKPASESGQTLAARTPLLRWSNYAIGVGVALVIVSAFLAFRIGTRPPISVARYTLLTNDGREKASPLFTDGARVYFHERSSNGFALASVSVRGGEVNPVPMPAGFDTFDIRPDSSEVIARRVVAGIPGRELWIVPLRGGPPRRLGQLRANYARFAPDGKHIALALDEDLSLANADGSGLRNIAHWQGTQSDPRWSPDGKKIRFTHVQDDSRRYSIWEINADGSGLHELLSTWQNPPGECCGAWTPDGSFYIFQSTRDGRTDLWALSEQALWFSRKPQSPTLLTSGLQGYSSPLPSSDGKQAFGIGTENRGELVRFDPRSREFVRMLGGIPATWVNFSRSGSSVVYIRYPDSTVWRSNLDGSAKTQITFAPFEADGLAWSPDERWLAMRGRTPGEPWKIYLVPSSGGMPGSILAGEKEEAVPTWSPDSSSLAFGDVPAVYGRPLGTERIHILSLSDRSLKDLPGSDGLWTARWAPDGLYLAALTIRNQELMLYDFRAARWRSTGADHVNNPTWSRDSSFVYYDTEGQIRALRRFSVPDGRVEQLLNLETFPTLSWWWSGVTPDNCPLILRNLGSTEIYALVLDRR